MDDAVRNASTPLTHDRLKGWQAALFPTGYSGMTPIRVGDYRAHTEPMQIVSGSVGREKVHYQAPPSAAVEPEMSRFLLWFNGEPASDSLVKAALAHFWFEAIHPFEDGNGRVGRVIVDLVLANDAGEPSRLLRISEQLLAERSAYYDELERAQQGSLNVTPWVVWFLRQVRVACDQASRVIEESTAKARFWQRHQDKQLSARQRKVVNVLLDAGPGGLRGA